MKVWFTNLLDKRPRGCGAGRSERRKRSPVAGLQGLYYSASQRNFVLPSI